MGRGKLDWLLFEQGDGNSRFCQLPRCLTPGEASAAVGKLDSSLPVEELVRLSLKALGRKG